MTKPTRDKPTLKSIWARVADDFTPDAFSVYKKGRDLSISNKKDGHSLQVADNGDGTFCLNTDGHETFNQNPPEKAIAAIASYYKRYKP
jgi:hypothetical protein